MKRKVCNWPRHILQWGTLAALVFFISGLAAKLIPSLEKADPEAYCPMGGLGALATYVQRGSLPCSMTSLQILIGIALAAATMLFSKLFCGYLCPVGTVEDLLKKLRKALNIRAVRIDGSPVADKVLRAVKYGLVFWIFYMTIGASELFCKNLDPYYAVATGFKGEITLWMSITSLVLVLGLGLFVDRFWCKYICPLGAISNSLKFWLPMVLLALLCWVLDIVGLHIPWPVYLGAFCVVGYLLEILTSGPKLQPLRVVLNEDKCGRSCYSCMKNCPYGINVPAHGERMNHVDCTLCGQCVASCPTGALSIGVKPVDGDGRKGFARFIPAIAAVVLMVAAFLVGRSFELPTLDETWDVTPEMQLETVTVENLKSVKCYGSSKAFMARMQHVRGVHGVKTYIGSHHVVISYDPKVVTAEKIQEEVFVPSHFRVLSPDPKVYDHVKCVTIRTEKMGDKLDLNHLGLQFRLTGKAIFGLESEYDCPLIVRVYMAPDEELDEAWFRDVVNRKSLDMPVHGGGVKATPVDFEFVRMEKGHSDMPIAEYLERMFDGFQAEFNGRYPSGDTTVVRKRAEVYAGKPQYVYEIADQNYEKPIIKRALPYLSNHLSSNEGVIGVYLCLNKDLVPSIQVRFAEPMTSDKIWELITRDTWTITYKENEDVREEPSRMSFSAPGVCYGL